MFAEESMNCWLCKDNSGKKGCRPVMEVPVRIPFGLLRICGPHITFFSSRPLTLRVKSAGGIARRFVVFEHQHLMTKCSTQEQLLTFHHHTIQVLPIHMVKGAEGVYKVLPICRGCQYSGSPKVSTLQPRAK